MSKLRALVFGLFLSSMAMPVYAAGTGAGGGAGAGAAAGSAGAGAGIGAGSTAPGSAGLPGMPTTPLGAPNNTTTPSSNPTGQPNVNGVGQNMYGNTAPCNNTGMAASGPCSGPPGTAVPNAPGTTNALPNSTTGTP